MTKNLTLKLALILVILLNFTQLLQQTIIDLFNLITNSNLMELLPLAVSSTMAIISLILSPILISLEIKEMLNRKLNDPTNIISILKIILLSAAMLISASSLLGFQLPVILLSTIPLAGLILATCGLLYQIATKFNKAQNYKQKTAYLFLGMLILGLSSLAFLGALSVTAALVVLIGAFIFNSANRFKIFTLNINKLSKTFSKDQTQVTKAKDIRAETKKQQQAENEIQQEPENEIQQADNKQQQEAEKTQQADNKQQPKAEQKQQAETEQQQEAEKTQQADNKQQPKAEQTQQEQLMQEISNDNEIQALKDKITELNETIKNLQNEIKSLKQSQNNSVEDEAENNTRLTNN